MVLTPAIEVWLTAEDVQFYLVVCAALICISEETRHRVLRSTTLLLSGLTGPVSCVLTPFFIFRAYRRRTGGAVLQACIMSACSAIQATIMLCSLQSGVRPLNTATNFEWFGPALFIKIFAVTFFSRLGALVAQRTIIHHTNYFVGLLFWLFTFISFFVFWKLARGTAATTVLGMAVVSLIFNYSGITEPLSSIFVGAQRYFFPGYALLWLVPIVAYAEQRDSTTRRRQIALVFSLVLLSWGALDAAGYWTRGQRLAPDWKAQVAAWRKDPNHPIRVSPYEPVREMHLHVH